MHPSFDMVEFQTVSSIALCCAANYSENREHRERPDREEITPVYYPAYVETSFNLTITGEYMNLRIRMVGMAVTALLTSISYGQTPATISTSQNSTAHAVATAQVPLTKKAARAANRDFAKRVQKIIYKTQGLNGSDIVVFATANTGQVTLSGSVLSEDQNHIATVAAGRVQGVTSVKSLLTLQEEGS